MKATLTLVDTVLFSPGTICHAPLLPADGLPPTNQPGYDSLL